MVGADYCIAQRPASSPEGGKRRPNQRATSRPTAVRPDSDLAASYLDAWSHMRTANCCRIAAFGMAFAAELQNVVASRPNSGKLPCLQTRRGLEHPSGLSDSAGAEYTWLGPSPTINSNDRRVPGAAHRSRDVGL